MSLIEETRKTFEEYLALAQEGILRNDSFMDESVKALKSSLQGKIEVLRSRIYGKSSFSSHRDSIIEGF